MEQSTDRNDRLDELGNAHLVARLARARFEGHIAPGQNDLPEYAELIARGFSPADIETECAHLIAYVHGEAVSRRPVTRFSLLRSISNIRKIAKSLAVVAALLFVLLFSGALNDSVNGATYIGGAAIIAMLAAFLAWSRLSLARLKLAQHEAKTDDAEES